MGQHDEAITELERIATDADRADAAQRQQDAQQEAEQGPTVATADTVRDTAIAAAQKALGMVELGARLYEPAMPALPPELYEEAGRSLGPFIQDRGWDQAGLLKVGPYDNAIKAGMFVGSVVVATIRGIQEARDAKEKAKRADQSDRTGTDQWPAMTEGGPGFGTG